jgi:hypothetical protein
LATKNPLVEQKLKDAIIPYLILSERLWYQPVSLLYAVYAYTQDLSAAVAGAGFSFPLTAMATGDKIDLPTAIQKMPGWLQVLTIVSFVMWTVLKVVVKQTNAEKRATLARSCRKDFRGFANTCESECQKLDPMPGLEKLGLDIQATVARSNAEDAWFWAGLPVDKKFLAEIDARLLQYCNRYGSNWRPPPPPPS